METRTALKKIIFTLFLIIGIMAAAFAVPSAALAYGVGEEDMANSVEGEESALANAQAGEDVIKITVFWREGCPHCEKEFAFLDELKKQYPELEVKSYEVSKSPENAQVFKELMGRVGAKQLGVPATIIGNSVFIGFSEDTANQIEQQIRLIRAGRGGEAAKDTVWIPLLGQVSADDFSLPVFTLIVAGADSINPCALFVLLFLLSFLVHVRSRMRMAVVGGTFVFFSGFIYFLFMAAWLNLFFVLGKINTITLVAGVVAMVIGAINVKDFFAFKN